MPDGWDNPTDDQLVQRVPRHFPTSHTIMPKNPNFPRPIQPPVIIKLVRKIKKAANDSVVRVLNALRLGHQAQRQRHTIMKSNHQRTADWLKACGKEPGQENLSLQIGCHIEEFCEFLGTLRTDSEGYALLIEQTREDLELFASKLKRGEQFVHIPYHLRADALDALCDTEVTGNGVAYLAQFNKEIADQRVLQSNDDKLVDGKPVILEGGKIGKPDGWKPPQLGDLV